MNPIGAIFLIIAIIIAMICVATGAMKCFFNALALWDAEHDPDHTKQKYGMIYSEKDDGKEAKLDADQATILPF